MFADAHALVLDKYHKGRALRRLDTSQMVDLLAIFYIIQKLGIYIIGISRSSTCQTIFGFRTLLYKEMAEDINHMFTFHITM